MENTTAQPAAVKTSLGKNLMGFFSSFFNTLFNQLEVFWTWVDKHNIEQHAVSTATLVGLVYVMKWAFAYADTHNDGNTALIIAAVTAPYSVLQGAVLKFYFHDRSAMGTTP